MREQRPRQRYGLILPGERDSLQFRNDDAEAAPPYAVMEIIGSGFRGTGGTRPYLKCQQPSDTFCRFYAVNRAQSIDPGEFGRCTLLAPAFVLCEDGVETPTLFAGWGPHSGSWELHPYRHGFTSLGNVTGSNDDSDRRAWFTQREVNQVKGYLTDPLSLGATASIEIWVGEGGSEFDSGMLLVTRDWLMKSGASDIAAETKVLAEFDCGVWYISEAQCP